MDELDVPLWQLMNWKKFTFDPYSAGSNALTLCMALSILTHHGIPWVKPSVAELQLGIAYYHLIEAEMDKLYAEQKKALKKQRHNLDRSIPRPTAAKTKKAKSPR